MKKIASPLSVVIFVVIAALLISAAAVAGVGLAERTFVPESVPEPFAADFFGIVDSLDEKNMEYYSEIHAMKDLHDLVSSWAINNNEAKMHLSNVTTYLLVVKEAGAITTNYGNADIISLVSVNTETKEVNIVAIDNDCLVYVDLRDTSLQADGAVYAKLNTAYANGGIGLLINTIEQNFKIKIDHYLVTDMQGVEKTVKALGGISVMLDQQLKDMITDDFNVIMPGNNTPLNGQQMVGYLREKRDGAQNRMERLAEALTAAIKTAQRLNLKKSLDLVKILAEVANTDLAGLDLFNAVRSTLLGGWDDYEVVGVVSPDEENAVNYKDSSWIRIIDIPVEAQAIQEKLFNKTNITLNTSRLSAVDLLDAVNKVYQDELDKATQPDELPENSENAEENTDGEKEDENSNSLG